MNMFQVPEKDDLIDPESLAAYLVQLGDGVTASALIGLSKKRISGSTETLDRLLERALSARERNGEVPGIDERTADALAQRGYLSEALLIFDRLDAMGRLKRPDRAELVRRIRARDLPAGSPESEEAESLLAQRRVASALLAYRAVARHRPDDAFAVGRAQDLRDLLLGDPGAVRDRSDAESIRDVLIKCGQGRYTEALFILSPRVVSPEAPAEIRRLFEAVDRVHAFASTPTGSEPVTLQTGRASERDLAVVHCCMGNLEETRDLLKKVLETGPTAPDLDLLLEDLEEIRSRFETYGVAQHVIAESRGPEAGARDSGGAGPVGAGFPAGHGGRSSPQERRPDRVPTRARETMPDRPSVKRKGEPSDAPGRKEVVRLPARPLRVEEEAKRDRPPARLKDDRDTRKGTTSSPGTAYSMVIGSPSTWKARSRKMKAVKKDAEAGSKGVEKKPIIPVSPDRGRK